MASYIGDLTVTKIRLPKQGFLQSLKFWELKCIWKVHVPFRYVYGDGPEVELEADFMFLEFMSLLEVPRWKAEIMYWAVSKFGQSSYDKNKKGV